MFTAGRALIPRREGQKDLTGKYDVREFMTELQVRPDSPAAGRTFAEVRWGEVYGVSILGLRRSSRSLWGPVANRRVTPGDLLYAQGHSQNLLRLAEKEKLDKDFKADSRVGRKATYEVFRKMKDKGKDGEASLRAAPATLVVSLPANARLTVDGVQTRSTSGLRTFVSPSLEAGKTFAYTLTASYTREGQPVSVSKRVQVEAGQTVKVNMHSATAVASR